VKSKWLIIGLLGVIVALVVAIPLAIRYSRYQEARSAVARYAIALDATLAELRPQSLGATALQRETGRVTSYVTLLWGRNVYVDAELLEMDVLRVRSEDPTVTAIVRERWRYVEHDRRSREQLGDEETEDNTLRYTLLPGTDGRLAVYLSEILEPEELQAELEK